MSDNDTTTTDESTDSTEPNEDVLAVELVLGADRPTSQQTRLDVTSATVTDRAMGRLEITLADGGVEAYLAELGLKHGTDEFATDGGEEVSAATQHVREARDMLSDFEDLYPEAQEGAIKHAIASLENARREL